jgi:hypothetical protein
MRTSGSFIKTPGAYFKGEKELEPAVFQRLSHKNPNWIKFFFSVLEF